MKQSHPADKVEGNIVETDESKNEIGHGYGAQSVEVMVRRISVAKQNIPYPNLIDAGSMLYRLVLRRWQSDFISFNVMT